jgi:hypothetical protein
MQSNIADSSLSQSDSGKAQALLRRSSLLDLLLKIGG